jgi:hypothetical protein
VPRLAGLQPACCAVSQPTAGSVHCVDHLRCPHACRHVLATRIASLAAAVGRWAQGCRNGAATNQGQRGKRRSSAGVHSSTSTAVFLLWGIAVRVLVVTAVSGSLGRWGRLLLIAEEYMLRLLC